MPGMPEEDLVQVVTVPSVSGSKTMERRKKKTESFGATSDGSILVKPQPQFSPGDMHDTRRPSGACEERMEITFRNVNYSVKVKAPKKGKTQTVIPETTTEIQEIDSPKKSRWRDKRILRDVTGCFQAGRFCAILGASGAGKTSLLYALAGQRVQGKVTGDVLVNGQNVGAAKMRKISAFVFQDDIILATMTVREAITMSALLRLPRSVPSDIKQKRVDDIISLLGLDKCAETLIGNATQKGISGGERKRCAIAMELITSPSILYLDEPTSGLDTFTAYSVVYNLKQVAKTGRTVIATLHQPSSEIFHMFDDLLILSEGSVIFFGPASDSMDYFSEKGFPCPRYCNPADHFFLNILNVNPTSRPRAPSRGTFLASAIITRDITASNKSVVNARLEQVHMLVDAWPTTPLGVRMQNLAENPNGSGVHSEVKGDGASISTQFKVLSRRAWKNALRNKMQTHARFAQAIFVSVLCGLIFLQVSDDQIGVQNRNGALFFITVSMVFSPTLGVLSVFSTEKEVFAREYGSGMYGVFAYFLTKFGVELPFQILNPIIFAAISYWMIGFQANTEKFFIFATTLVLLSNCGNSLGLLVSASFREPAIALMAAPAILLPLMIFSGFFVNNDQIPVYFNWIKYLSPMKWGFECLAKNEYTGLKLTCTSGMPCQGTTGEQILAVLGLNDGIYIPELLIILLSFCVVLFFAAFFVLSRVVKTNH